MWKEWLRLHRESVEAITADQDLVTKMDNAVQKEKIERNEFEKIQGEVIETLAKYGSMDNIHSIANLALLRRTDNAALNNSTFDVKRNEIIEMDKRGQYIPFCTKMVFLKYYTPSAKNQIHFWGKSDRDEYIRAINRVLGNYLTEPISLEKEGK